MDILQRAEAAKRLAPLATRILIDDLLKEAGLFQVAEPAPEAEPEQEPVEEAAPEDDTEVPDATPPDGDPVE